VSLRQDGFSKADARGVAARCVRSYREHINDFAALGVLERWYTQISTDDLLATLHSRKAKKWVQARIDKASSKAALDHLSKVLAVEQPALRIHAFDPGDMRTEMHQRAFPSEDVSDRPEPETVVPALLRLLDERPASGRYRASELLVPEVVR